MGKKLQNYGIKIFLPHNLSSHIQLFYQNTDYLKIFYYLWLRFFKAFETGASICSVRDWIVDFLEEKKLSKCRLYNSLIFIIRALPPKKEPYAALDWRIMIFYVLLTHSLTFINRNYFSSYTKFCQYCSYCLYLESIFTNI